MTNEQILTKAIEKAIQGGWKAESLGDAEAWRELSELERQYVIKLLLREGEGNGYWLIIFNHDFAKALWGEHEVGDMSEFPLPRWQYCLREMVIADDPIAYLGEHLD